METFVGTKENVRRSETRAFGVLKDKFVIVLIRRGRGREGEHSLSRPWLPGCRMSLGGRPQGPTYGRRTLDKEKLGPRN